LTKIGQNIDKKLTETFLETSDFFLSGCIFRVFPMVHSKTRYQQRFWRKTQKIIFFQISRITFFPNPKRMGRDILWYWC